MDLGMAELLYPKRASEQFRRMREDAGWDLTISNVLIAFLVLLFAFLTLALMSATLEGPTSGILGGFGKSLVDGSLNYLLFAFYVLSCLLAFFVAGLLLHLIALIFGGQGAAEVTLYLIGGLLFLFSPILSVGMILLVVPCIGYLGVPMILGASIYALLLLHKGVMAVHDLDKARSAIAVLVWVSAILTTFALLAIIGFILGFEKLSWLLP